MNVNQSQMTANRTRLLAVSCVGIKLVKLDINIVYVVNTVPGLEFPA